MALDGANFIAELSITDPPGSDPLAQGDDQIRTIKRATFQSFPLIAAAVNLTDVQMNLMAIKNEANVFTLDQTIRDADLQLDGTIDSTRNVHWSRSGVRRWTLRMDSVTNGLNFLFQRRDILGALVDVPWSVSEATGVVEFPLVPTIAGAPIWTAGEVKMLVQGAAAPGTNWFSANGTNGTIDLRDRFLATNGVFFGTRAPFLDAQTTVGPITGSTVLTEAQLASHRHRIAEKSLSGGQVQPNPATFMSAGQGVAGVILSTGTERYADQTDTRAIIENTGASAGHTHTIPELEVETAGSDAFQVVPFGYFMQTFQYVP